MVRYCHALQRGSAPAPAACLAAADGAAPAAAGEHGWWDESASVWLSAGWRQLQVEFFNGGGMGGEVARGSPCLGGVIVVAVGSSSAAE